MSFVNKLLHSQRGSNVAQAAGVAIVATAVIGALLLFGSGLSGATSTRLSCLLASISGGGAGCSGGQVVAWRSPAAPPDDPPADDETDVYATEPYDAPDGTRPLTPEERALAEEIFGPGALDLDVIRITPDGPYLEERPYVYGNTIHWPDDVIDTPGLAHELVHVYQFQRRGWVYWREAAVLQGQYSFWRLVGDRLGFGSSPYDYGGADGLNQAREDGKTFGDFNVEEQGQIVEDYMRRRQNGEDTTAYDPFIEDLRGGDIEDDFEDPGVSVPLTPPVIWSPWNPTYHVDLPFDVPDVFQPWVWDTPDIWVGPVPMEWDTPDWSPPWTWDWEVPHVSPPWDWF